MKGDFLSLRVGAEKNNPTVLLRVVRGKPSAWGYNWATLYPGDINLEAWSSMLGVGRGDKNPTP
jgi:hypothetical protein